MARADGWGSERRSPGRRGQWGLGLALAGVLALPAAAGPEGVTYSRDIAPLLAANCQACHRDGITINLFLVPSWSQSEDDIRFAYRLAESTKGRVFFTAGRDLDRYVVWDYVKRKREIVA